MAYPYQTYPMAGYGNPASGYYNQQGYQQAAYQSSQYMQPKDGIIRVTGMEGARAYQMPPNSREALFDDTDDVVIIKVTDGAGFPTFKRARLVWVDDNQPQQPAPDYLTREEFAKWKEEFENAQHAIPKRSRVAERETGTADDNT